MRRRFWVCICTFNAAGDWYRNVYVGLCVVINPLRVIVENIGGDLLYRDVYVGLCVVINTLRVIVENIGRDLLDRMVSFEPVEFYVVYWVGRADTGKDTST